MASDMASDIVSSDIVSSDMVPQFGRGMKILRVHKKNPNAGHSESGFAHSYPRVENTASLEMSNSVSNLVILVIYTQRSL